MFIYVYIYIFSVCRFIIIIFVICNFYSFLAIVYNCICIDVFVDVLLMLIKYSNVKKIIINNSKLMYYINTSNNKIIWFACNYNYNNENISGPLTLKSRKTEVIMHCHIKPPLISY